MIYAYDQALQMPTKDLYDTQMMAMALNTAKDMYEKGEQQIKDFNKQYGDFYSPIAADMKWYDENVTGRMRRVVDDLYARGIDPLRSAEGRAIIAREIASTPIGKINERKIAAANAEEYLKNKAKLEAAGLYNPDFEERYLNRNLSDWDTEKDGIWMYTSPMQARGLKELTSDWFDKRTAHDLTPEEVASFGPGYTYDPRYQYKGFTEGDLLRMAGAGVPGFTGTIWADYYRDLAKQQLQRSGIANPTTEQINSQLASNIAESNREWIIQPVKDEDAYALDDYRTRNDIRAHAANAAIDDKYAQIRHKREHPELYIDVTNSGNLPSTMNLNNHNGMTEATGIANLFMGKQGTIDDYTKNWKTWGDKMQDVERSIINEIKTEKGTIDSIKWRNRHLTHYDPSSLPIFLRVDPISAQGAKDGRAFSLSTTDLNSLYRLGEIMSRNYEKSARNLGSKLPGSSITKQSISKIDSKAYAHSTGNVLSQVEQDNRVHHYAEVKVYYSGDSETPNDTGYRTMYLDMGLESIPNGLTEDPTNFNRNHVRDFDATNQFSASRAATAEATQ